MDSEKDLLIIQKEKYEGNTGWKPITVSVEIYNSIRSISEETNMPISKIAGMLIDFALERVVIK